MMRGQTNIKPQLKFAHADLLILVIIGEQPLSKSELSQFKPQMGCTGLFISPSGISELDCATTKTDTAERSISIGRDFLQVFFFVQGAMAYFQVPPLGGSRDEKWRSQ